MDLVWVAFGIGLLSALSLPLGAITAFIWRLESNEIAAMMAFGGGALLAALSVDLVAPVLAEGHYAALFSGFLGGGLLFIGLNRLVNDFGGFKRKLSTTVHHSRRETRRKLRQILSHLDRTPIFEGLSDAEFHKLAEDIEPHFFPGGSHIYQQGDPADALYVMVKGKVELRDLHAKEASASLAADTIHTTGAFGADSLFTGSPHAVSATAVDPTWIWRIPEASLRRLLVESPVFQQTLRERLQSDHLREYLIHRQGMSEPSVEAWLDDANETLDEEGRLPDVKPVERRTEAFLSFANQIDRVPWLEDLSQEDANVLALHLVYRRYQAGDILFQEGEAADRLFLLEEGGITLSDSSHKLLPSRHDAGDGISMRSFLAGVRHTIRATASTSCGVWTLSREDFRRLLGNHPDFRNRVVGYLQAPGISAYLRQRYQLDGGKIQAWLTDAKKAVTAGKLPPSLLLRGVESGEPSGAAVAIWLGILLDGIPESMVIGANLTASGISLSLVVGLFLANYPEALSSAQGMLQENFSRKRILLMWSSIMLLTGVGAALGKVLIDIANPEFFPFLEGLAAGAMLTMIAQTMLPEAYIKGGSIVGFATLMGFLATIAMKTVE